MLLRTSKSRAGLLLSTIGGSMLIAGCGATPLAPDLPAPAIYAPAEVKAPYIPKGPAVEATDGTTLSLDQVLIYADAHAPSIQVARAQVGLADAAIIEAQITFPANPQISFSTGARNMGGAMGFEFEAAVQQQLELAGEQSLRRDAAQDRKRAAEGLVNEVRWSVHVESHRLFANLLMVRERLAQAERFVVFSEKLRDIAARQVEAGESSPFISLVADADLAQSREAIIQAKQLEASLATRLAAIIGWSKSTPPGFQGDLPDVKQAPEVGALESMMAKNHPALRTRELAVQAKRSRLALELREGYPEPTVGASYGRESSPGKNSGPGSQLWLLNVSVPIPVWRTNQGGKARAKAQVMIADRRRTGTIVRLRGKLREAQIALNAAADRVALYEQGVVPQLERNLSLLQRAYELGEVNAQQVSQTRERLLNATGQYIDARIAYYETAATLEGLVGTELWTEMEGSL